MVICVAPNPSYASPSSVSMEVRLTGKVSKTVRVSNYDQISTLLKELPKKNARLVYNGMVLNPSLTFSFYGISQKDLIFVISAQTKETFDSTATHDIPDITKQLREHFNKNWANSVSDPDAAFQRFNDSANPVTSMENARIMDLRKSKMEASPLQYRKLCQRFKKMEASQTQQRAADRPTSTSLL